MIGAAGQVEVPARIGEGAQLALHELEGEAEGLQGIDAIDEGLVAKAVQLHLAAPVAAGGLGIRLGGSDGYLHGQLFSLDADGIEARFHYGSLHLDDPFPGAGVCLAGLMGGESAGRADSGRSA